MARASPNKLTPELIDDLCEWLAEGQTMRAWCRQPGHPLFSTIYARCADDPAVEVRIARARKLGFDAIADEAMAIADEGPRLIESEFGDRLDPGGVAHQKLRIETRLKLLAKWDPRRYGDRLGLDATGGVSLTVVTGVPDADV